MFERYVFILLAIIPSLRKDCTDKKISAKLHPEWLVNV
jgi:hypothetical protein